ncbi:DNA polymerase III subunit gamma/tau [Patescibacteria group bacterium]|nr:DNA polymerase III subunit gamma/tau [Patescibacteria group bacterium]
MSNNFAYYLKYRPQAFSELVGQETVKQNLLLSFQSNKLSHAYLLVGPRGTGKTSTARILAKMVNCEKAVDGSSLVVSNSKASSEKETAKSSIPCNQCSVCISITDGSNLDLIEIDAASNRGIEDIRSLREKIKLAPSSLKKKVYIIDEVHMLTTEAFNALLKTLEEPPEHALFVLATTQLGKIPQTILSRVQRLDFKLASPGELLEVLTKIAKKEKISIDEEALKILVKKADGSFRDGVKLLDQISSVEGKITAKLIEENFKSSQFENVLNFIENLKNKNADAGLLDISNQVENGIDIKEFTLSLMDALRNLVLIKNGVGEQLVKHQLTEDKYQKLLGIAENFTNQELISNLNILQKVIEKLKFASIPSLPLELAVIEICGEQLLAKAEFFIEDSQSLTKEMSVKEKLDVESEKLDGEAKNSGSEDSGKDQTSSIQSQDPISNLQHPAPNSDILKLKEKWTFVLETIRPFNFSLEALLRSINIKECTDTTIVMEVPYSFHQRILEAQKNRDLLESIFSDILGRSIRMSTILGNRPEKREDVANVELAADDEIIRVAAEIFNSDIVN